MKHVPLVSIVIPCRNRKGLIRACLDSVLSQTFADHEVIVVDDGSTDGTAEMLESDTRYRHVRCLRHDSPRGAQAARNTGIRAARGRYVAFQDSDDEWAPNKLELQIAAAGKEDVVVHGDAFILDDDAGEPRRANVPPLSGNVRRSLLEAPGPLFPCILAPRSCLERVGFLDERVPAYQEWDTSIALSRYCDFRFVPRPLMTYRLHGDDQISKSFDSAAKGFLYIVEKHRSEIIEIAGPQAMNRHYLAIAERFLLAGHHRTAARHTLTAYRYSSRSIHLLARAALLASGKPGLRVLERRHRQRQEEMRTP